VDGDMVEELTNSVVDKEDAEDAEGEELSCDGG
jgi:hypothetical protein